MLLAGYWIWDNEVECFFQLLRASILVLLCNLYKSLYLIFQFMLVVASVLAIRMKFCSIITFIGS